MVPSKLTGRPRLYSFVLSYGPSKRSDSSEVLVNQSYFLAPLNAQVTPVLGR